MGLHNTAAWDEHVRLPLEAVEHLEQFLTEKPTRDELLEERTAIARDLRAAGWVPYHKSSIRRVGHTIDSSVLNALLTGYDEALTKVSKIIHGGS
jgi:hypothetical protein